jgi:uncharacterized membrane protein
LLGPVVGAYVVGIVIRNSGYLGVSLIPGDPRVFASTAELTFALAILTAIPLMLFTADFITWVRTARPAATAFALSCVSITVMGALVIHGFGYAVDEGWKVACMLVGSFTGGTPNFVSISVALKTTPEVFVVANTTEILSSAVYLLFITRFGKQVVGRWLPPFQPTLHHGGADEEPAPGPRRVTPQVVVRALGFAALLVGVSIAGGEAIMLVCKAVGVHPDVVKNLQLPIMVLLVTTLSVGASFIPWVKRLTHADQVGDYAILVFSVSFGTLIDASQINITNVVYFQIAFLILLLTLPCYYLLCRLFRIDTDTALVVSSACVFSPPFIPMVCESIGNRNLILTGITTGVAGYAVGNYLGLFLAWMLAP